jgi:cytosine/adenosine deaminase-related metal-dependent hydrolase
MNTHQPRQLLITGSYILTLDNQLGDLPTGDILIHGSRISQIAPRITPGPDFTGQTIDASGMIAAPGLIDNHRHLWQSLVRGQSANHTFGQYFTHTLEDLSARYSPEDIYLANLLSLYEALDAGITTLLDWSHATNTPEHAAAALQALCDSPARAVFAYGPPSNAWWQSDGPPTTEQVTNLHTAHRATANRDLVGFALAIRGPEFSHRHRCQADLELARGLGIPITTHAGIPGFYHQSPTVRLLDREGLLDSDLTFVHCNAMTTDDFRIIAEAGAHVSCSPEVEMQMGFGPAPLAAILAGGARPTVSVDVVSAIGGDLLTQTRILLQSHRAAAHQHHLATAGTPLDILPVATRDALAYATSYAAASLGLQDQIGTLTPGKQADLVLYQAGDLNLFLAEPGAALIQAAHPGNIDSVLVAGRIVKQHRRLVGPDLDQLRAKARRAHKRLLTR